MHYLSFYLLLTSAGYYRSLTILDMIQPTSANRCHSSTPALINVYTILGGFLIYRPATPSHPKSRIQWGDACSVLAKMLLAA
jgi:hypothetical protein